MPKRKQQQGWRRLELDQGMLRPEDAAEFISIEVLDVEPPAEKKPKPADDQPAPQEEPAGAPAERKLEKGKEKLRKYKEKKKRQKAAKRAAAAAAPPEQPAAEAAAAVKKAAPKRPVKRAAKPSAGPAAEAEAPPAEAVKATKRQADGWEPDPGYSAWLALGLSGELLRGVEALGFRAPTPIQNAAVPVAIQSRKDVVGAAETGSGKTLAFGLPVLETVMSSPADGLRALVVSPTRELAVQIKDHLEAVARFTSVRVAVIVGGLSLQKQERVLKHRPAVVVGTPGRLWEMISDGVPHLAGMDGLRCLVLDEADRLVEQGHFLGVSRIIEYIASRQARCDNAARLNGEEAGAKATARPPGVG